MRSYSREVPKPKPVEPRALKSTNPEPLTPSRVYGLDLKP